MDLHNARVLAFGTAGAQGSGLLEALSGRGAVAVRASSNPERVASWGADAVLADLARPTTVAAAAAQADAAVLHVPLGLGSPEGGAAVVASIGALREAGLPVAVNLGSPVPPPAAPDPFGVRPLAAAVLATGAVALTPTAYLENHAAPWALGPISAGTLVYPRPAHDTLAWITARDVTAAAVAALVQDRSAELLILGGPRATTFDELAAEIGDGLGRSITFRRIAPAEYGELLRPVLGDGAAAGVAAAYDAMPEGPNPLMNPDTAGIWRELGLTPTSAQSWAATVLAPLLRTAA